MRPYLIHITLPGGARLQHKDSYANSFDAVIWALNHFPNAVRIFCETNTMTEKPKTHRTCNQLGVCQAANPRCPGCVDSAATQYPFAPGVIDGAPITPRPTPARWLQRAAYLVGAMAIIGFCAGYLVGCGVAP